MTREEMADVVHIVADAVAAIKAEHYKEHSADLFDDSDAQSLMAAADELRKTCGSCVAFTSLDYESNDGLFRRSVPWCATTSSQVPADGSGHCHRHESQPTGQAQD